MNGSDLSLFPPSASTVSAEVDMLFFYIASVCAFFFVLIFALLVWFAVKYRRSEQGEVVPQVHGNIPLELFWTAVPLVLVLSFFAWGADLFFRIKTPPTDPLEVYVVGKQWMWKIQHQQGPREINHLHIPVDTPVKLTMTSEDVIHSFYVPAFRVKQDVLPGRYTTLWFEATKVGEYHLFCTEYCGTEHAGMGGSVIVMEREDYEAWLSGGAAGESLVVAGERLFGQLGCQTCHGDQPGARGPSLSGVFGSEVQLSTGQVVVADDAYLRESIMSPQAKLVNGYEPIMPQYPGIISEEGLLQLIAYVKSLAPPPAEPAAAANGNEVAQ
jgi:cytochrome c oxidase subunit 2